MAAPAAMTAAGASPLCQASYLFYPHLSGQYRELRSRLPATSNWKPFTLFMVSANGFSPQLLMTGKGPSISLANLCETEQRGCCYYWQYKVLNRPQNRKIKTSSRHVREIPSSLSPSFKAAKWQSHLGGHQQRTGCHICTTEFSFQP